MIVVKWWKVAIKLGQTWSNSIWSSIWAGHHCWHLLLPSEAPQRLRLHRCHTHCKCSRNRHWWKWSPEHILLLGSKKGVSPVRLSDAVSLSQPEIYATKIHCVSLNRVAKLQIFNAPRSQPTLISASSHFTRLETRAAHAAHQTCSRGIKQHMLHSMLHSLVSMFLKFLGQCHHRLHISTGSIDYDGNAHTWLQWLLIPDTHTHTIWHAWCSNLGQFQPMFFTHFTLQTSARIVNTLVEQQRLAGYQQALLA